MRASADRVDVTVSWDNGENVASLGVSRDAVQSPLRCPDLQDATYEPMRVNSEIRGCGYVNDFGLLFLRWHEDTDAYLFQISGVTPPDALDYLETWEEV